jgi:hypothetical protein
MQPVQIKISLYKGRFAFLRKILSYTVTRNLPTCWDEVDRRTALAYAATVSMRLQEIFGLDEDGNPVIKNTDIYFHAKTALLYYMLRVKLWIFLLIEDVAIASLLEESSVTDFFFEQKITRNYYPHLRPGIFGKKLHGPVNMYKLKGEEFAFTDGYFIQYKNGIPHALDFFIASLYRQKKYDPKAPKWNGDKREPFNRTSIDQRAELMQKIRPSVKILIANWYEAKRQDWEEEFEHVFPRAGSSGEETNKTWIDVLLSLSGSKFGAYDQTSDSEMYLILKRQKNCLYKPQNQ